MSSMWTPLLNGTRQGKLVPWSMPAARCRRRSLVSLGIRRRHLRQGSTAGSGNRIRFLVVVSDPMSMWQIEHQ